MLSGWYCRSLANEQAESQGQRNEMESGSGSDDEQEQEQNTDAGTTTNAKNVDHRAQYKYLKRKLKYLIYENEFFQDALRSNQRRLVKVTRDRAFLLDRLMQYEKPENTSSESDTESSEDEITKKRKLDQEASAANGASGSGGATAGPTRGRKKKMPSTPLTVAEKAPSEMHSTLEQSTAQNNIIEEEVNTSIDPQFSNCVQTEYNN